MITDEVVEAALMYIRKGASKHAQAKANRIQIEQFRKSKKALLMNEVEGAEHIRASYAYAHESYIELMKGLPVAVEIEEELLWKMRAAQLTVEIYRTQQANNRFIDKAHT